MTEEQKCQMKAAACLFCFFFLFFKAAEKVREESSLINTEKLLHFKSGRDGKNKSCRSPADRRFFRVQLCLVLTEGFEELFANWKSRWCRLTIGAGGCRVWSGCHGAVFL